MIISLILIILLYLNAFQADSTVTVHTMTRSFSLVTSYELCLACQYLILNQTNHKLRKKLAN